MKFVSWNVNGLRSCMGKGFVEFLEDVQADVFCVQETKMCRYLGCRIDVQASIVAWLHVLHGVCPKQHLSDSFVTRPRNDVP